MKRVLILGCNEVTKRLLVDLCKHRSYASDICLASRRKEECDELRNLAASMGVRVITAGIDMNNIEGAMMMIKIFAPDLVVNLLPVELTHEAMNLAAKAQADYLDGSLFGVPDIPSSNSFLSRQFEKFAEFQRNGKTAVCGSGFIPGLVNTVIRYAMRKDFRKVDSIDLVAVSGEKKAAARSSKKNTNDDILYSEDIKEPESIKKIKADRRAFYIEDGKVVETEAMSIEAESSSGSKVYLAPSPMLTDIVKEIPDINNIRYFKLGRKPANEHKAPKDKIEFLEEMGLLSKKPVKVGDVEIAPLDLVAAVLPKMADNGTPQETEVRAKGIASYEIYITGKSKKDDKEITRSYIISEDNDMTYDKYEVNAFEYMKGSAIIAGVKLMCRDKWKKPGVFTPAAFDCEEYFKAFTMEGIEVVEGEGKPF